LVGAVRAKARPRSMTTVLDDVLDLSGSMTAGLYSLTADSLAVLFYMWNYMNRVSTWRKFPGEEITPEESDIIDALISDTMRQIMTPTVGQITAFITLEPPPNVLPCDGSTYLRVDYPMLYDVLDPAFILDADSFFVPDLSDQTIIGASVNFPFNSTGGEVEHELTASENGQHSHSDLGHDHIYQPPGATAVAVSPGELPVLLPALFPTSTLTGYASIADSGSGTPHNNMQPYRALRYGVYAA